MIVSSILHVENYIFDNFLIFSFSRILPLFTEYSNNLLQMKLTELLLN